MHSRWALINCNCIALGYSQWDNVKPSCSESTSTLKRQTNKMFTEMHWAHSPQEPRVRCMLRANHDTPFQFYHKALHQELWRRLQTEWQTQEFRAISSSQSSLSAAQNWFSLKESRLWLWFRDQSFLQKDTFILPVLCFWTTVTSMCICTDITGNIVPWNSW